MPILKFLGGNKKSGQINMILLLAVAILLAAGVLRVIEWVGSTSSRPILTQAEGLVRLTDPGSISNVVPTSYSLPKQTFGSTLHVIGTYPEPNGAFETGTIALVYARDGWRFVEVNIQPNQSLERAMVEYAGFPTEDVQLNEQTVGKYVDVRRVTDCIEHDDENVPGVCQISRVLLFENDERLITIAADGDHASDGELIEMGRSMLEERD